MNNKPIVVLDACVIYPAPIRDFLLYSVIESLFSPKWSDKIQNGWFRNLLLKRPDLSENALKKTINAMNQAFQEANVETDNILEKKLNLPDKNDNHFLATALKANANFIITFNLKDFPSDYLSQFNVQAISPDDFLLDLYLKNPPLVEKAFQNQVRNLKNPPIKHEDLLVIFVKVDLNKIASKLKRKN